MSQVLAVVVFGCLAIAVGCALLSVARPELRTWPPPRTTPWPRPLLAVVGRLFPLGLFGQLPLGLLDWNSLVLPPWVRLVGCALFLFGGFFAGWGYRTLGAHISSGQEGGLIEAGAYRFSRNPQYIGAIAGFVGYALLCNSSLTLITSGLAAISFLVLPFAEEPWLRELLRAAYRDYCTRVPRFLPFSPGWWIEHSSKAGHR